MRMGFFSILGLHTLTVDDLMMLNKVQACDGGFVCMICDERLSSSRVRAHMRDIHLSSDGDFHCPPWYCDRYFKNRKGIYDHIRKWHKDWKSVNYDDFAVNSESFSMS